jgi:hypothetical protein
LLFSGLKLCPQVDYAHIALKLFRSSRWIFRLYCDLPARQPSDFPCSSCSTRSRQLANHSVPFPILSSLLLK